MNLNIINGLTVQFNEHPYKENQIYITIGIKFGFSIDRILILPQNEIKKINQASGDVFINYINLIMKEQYNINIKGNVKTNNIYFSMKSEKDRMDHDLKLILKTIFESEVNEGIFNRARKITKDNFKDNYKNINFRAYYKMMEFSNINKRFSLEKFTKDLLNINLQDFKDFMDNIVVFQNSILFINGDLNNIENSKIFEYIESIETKDILVKPIVEMTNKYLQSDMHLVQYARESVSLGGINFNFFNEDITITEKQLLMSILSEIMFEDKGKAIVDEFDNSLLYFNLKLDEYSTKIFDYLDNKSVSKAKDKILYKLSYILENKPYLFNKYCIDLYSKGINFLEYLDALNSCNYISLQDIFIKGNLKITEGHLLYIKEE